jgi:3-phenylpropionate/trans-cinnamate dioxygenase ferredoxin reductase subunit
VVIVGAGLLGLEVAAALRARGASVTVLESADRPLARVLPAVVADHVADLHERRGVRVRCGVSVVAFVGTGRVRSVVLTDGSALSADLVVMAVGSTPNDAVAAAAGLDVRDGIVVDAGCRASLPSIYAIGDVARRRSARFGREWRLESWQNAQDQAAGCAAAILGAAPPPPRIPTFWTDQYDTTVQFAGLTDAGTRADVRGDPASGAFVVHCLRDDELVGVVGVNRPRDVRQARVAIEAGSLTAHERKTP